MPLRIEVPVSQAALDGWMDRLAVGAPVRVNVGRIQPPNNMWSLARGRLPIKRLAKLSPELARAHAQRMKPIVVRDPELGRLVLERELGWYRGKYAIADRRVRLSICQSAPNNDAAADARDIAAARATLLALSRGFTACERAIVKKMLPLYNRIWRGDRPVLAGAKLIERIKLDSIVVSPKRTTLYFRDGGLFLGHAIEVRMSRNKVREVVLSG